MKTALVVVLLMVVAPAVRAQEHADCPMHKSTDRRAEVDRRHQDETGLQSDGLEHHFLLSREGGSIRLEVKDSGQTEARDAVRAHLQSIARSFAQGDFSMPMHIHEQVPPGVEVMKVLKDTIRYAFSETPNGGLVTLATTDRVALAAIHDFLRFQVGDHGTADPGR